MPQIFQYYGQYQSVRGRLTTLPPFAKLILFLFALPGLLGAALSILLLGVSILALLLLTVPVYRLLAAVFPGRRATESETAANVAADVPPSPGRRHIDVTIVE